MKFDWGDALLQGFGCGSTRLDFLRLRAYRNRRRIRRSIKGCMDTNRGPSRRELDLLQLAYC
jgi:hypothetical protein